jgi:hypothetical protein
MKAKIARDWVFGNASSETREELSGPGSRMVYNNEKIETREGIASSN